MQYIHIRINELLEERMISKNRICKDLDLPRGNFNRYCRDDFQRIDANLIIKLCNYFGCSIADLLEMREEQRFDGASLFFTVRFIVREYDRMPLIKPKHPVILFLLISTQKVLRFLAGTITNKAIANKATHNIILAVSPVRGLDVVVLLLAVPLASL